MAEMNYVSYTKYQQGRAKIGDGKSVKVTVPAGSGAITAGEFYYFDGVVGVAMQSLENDDVNDQDLILQVELAEYETDQIDTSQSFSKGTRIYWDTDNNRFTETPTDIFAGIVTAAKDSNDVIWFLNAGVGLGDGTLVEATHGAPNIAVAGASTDDARVATIQINDAAGNPVSGVVAVRAWLSDTAGGAETSGAPTSDAGPDGTSGAELQEITAKVHYIGLTNESGELTFAVDDTGGTGGTWYLNVEWQGYVYSSEGIEVGAS